MGNMISSYEHSDSFQDQYVELRKWRDQKIASFLDPAELNIFHDNLIKRIVRVALDKVQSEWGPPPAHFDFFIMGSGGRSEQSIWSDQDHGIIFEGGNEAKPYFLTLGAEIAQALYIGGYEYCDGKVMSSNSRWCHSVVAWKQQIQSWLDEESWESLRYFSTFFDSRVLIGDSKRLLELKKDAFSTLEKEPHLYKRLSENVGYYKKGIGLFGQLLPISHGESAGCINLKETVFFPYVNSLRLLSFKEQITKPSTLSRFDELSTKYSEVVYYRQYFLNLLHYRLSMKKGARSYKNVHLLNIETLTKEEKRELKEIMKMGYKLFSETKAFIGKGCSSW